MPKVLPAWMLYYRFERVYRQASMPCPEDYEVIEYRPSSMYFVVKYVRGPWKGAYFFVW